MLKTKSEAQKEIQKRLAKLNRDFAAIKKISDEFKVEFEFLGGTMHYRDFYSDSKKDAKTGFFCADSEWASSTMGCEDDDFHAWRRESWPEDYDCDED